MSKNFHFMFTYGTLKSGYGNNARCLEGAKLIGLATSVESNYAMTDVGYPFLSQPSKDPKFAGKATGEVYQINDEQLARCDRLEGHPNSYCREQREFEIGGVVDKAWVYLWKRQPYGDIIKPVNGLLTWDAGGKRKMYQPRQAAG